MISTSMQRSQNSRERNIDRMNLNRDFGPPESCPQGTSPCSNESKGILMWEDFDSNLLANNSRSTSFREAVEDLGLNIQSSTSEPSYVCHNGSSCIDVSLSTARTGGHSVEECETLPSSDRKHRPLRFSLGRSKPRELGARPRRAHPTEGALAQKNS